MAHHDSSDDHHGSSGDGDDSADHAGHVGNDAASGHNPSSGDPNGPDDWERVGATCDWGAALLADRVDREPLDLVRPALGIGLVGGLGAEALNTATGGNLTQVLLGVALTLFGYGMLWLLAERFRRGSSGGARTAEADLLAPWLRRLQVLMLAVLAIVVGLVLVGAVTGSWLLVARNLLELARVGAVVLVMSWLLLDGDVGTPAWLQSLGRRPATEA